MLSFDLECWFHAHNLMVPRHLWPVQDDRLEAVVPRLLDRLDRHNAKATFFVLGWVARHRPAWIRRIHAAGHEIASHGFGHRPVTHQSPGEFRDDTAESIAVLEDLTGRAIVGYRAPSYSVVPRSSWALDILAELGLRYDSSIVPVRAPHGRYGWPGAPIAPFEVRPGLMEFPLPTVRLLGFRLPAAAGGYLRLLPRRLTQMAFKQAEDAGRPIVVNIHPWELDPEQPRWPSGLLRQTLHYSGTGSMEQRLDWLLRSYRFERIADVIGNQGIDRHSVSGRVCDRSAPSSLLAIPECEEFRPIPSRPTSAS
ncbi:MAG: DUF3473 domain-containing protein [Phycisphaerae bacterium]|nr:DUF3473 domain-containing protein [Phycisphaerae bacterium]